MSRSMSPAPPHHKKRGMQSTQALAELFRAAGDPCRLAILCAVFDQPKICVSDIASQLRMSVATVSHHLHVLAKMGLLAPKREGKEVCYLFQNTQFAKDLKKFICKYNK